MTFSKAPIAVLFFSIMLIAAAYYIVPPVGYWVSSKDLFSSTVVVFSLLLSTLITVVASKRVEIRSMWVYALWIATFTLLIASFGLLIDWAYYDPLKELGVGSILVAFFILAMFLIAWALPATAREAGRPVKRRTGRGIAG